LIYADVPLYQFFTAPFIFGLTAFASQLPFSIPGDIQRIKGLRYGCQLKDFVPFGDRLFAAPISCLWA